MIKRSAEAIWRVTGKDGKGTLSTQSEVLNHTPYSFNTRFKGEKGSNPEELIGAAHAGCFSMALAFLLSESGNPPVEIRTSASIIMEEKDKGWQVTESKLTLSAKVPSLNESQIREFAEKAKSNCPISKLINAKISLEMKNS